nr:RNA methyltransferase [Bacillus piscicola]
MYKKKQREKDGLFVIEGFHLLAEALQYDVEIQEIFLQEEKEIPEDIHIPGITLTLVSSQVLKEMSMTETPQGVLAVCKLPKEQPVTILESDCYLFVDGVQDPGNLGTMIRTADAAGVSAVVLGDGTVDPFNDKVMRSAQGSQFHLPVIKGNLEDWIQACKQKGVPVLGSALDQEKGTTHTAIEVQDGFALIVGNEGAGVQASWLELSDQVIYVPIYGQAESLNVAVATGVLLYHLKKP